MTSLDDEDAALKALQLDIQDYLIKGEISGTALKRSIRYAMQRKRDSEALRQSEQRFASFMLHLPAAAWIKDLNGRYVYANAETERIVSLPHEAARQLGENDEQVLAEGRSLQTMETLSSPDGAEHHYIVSTFPVRGTDGRPAYVAGVAFDITDRRRAEEEIERLNAQLLARAAELGEANRELEAFNYTVAHDLRQPLNIICSYCQAIRELCGNKLDELCLGYLQETYDGALRMSSLIDALLNFSRMARVELQRETVDLSATARAVAGELERAEPQRRVTFRFAEGIMAEGDGRLLRAVLANLIGNAWKYSGNREEAVIEFGVGRIGEKTTYFVRDNGPGFAMVDAEKLFIPFQRAAHQEFTGHGIGLATVERIIRRHGGRVWAEGEPDKGATFYFTLNP
jgi:signal transduction histidine kinase